MKPIVFRQLIDASQHACIPVINQVAYEVRGITNFEALCLWSLIDYYKPEIIIESGVSKGRSTAVLCEAAKRLGVEHVYAFDKSGDFESYVRNKLAKYSNISYKIMDSNDGVTEILSKIDNKKVGVFIDGPKVGEAYANLMKTISKIPQLQFIVGHDCDPGSHTRTSFAKGYTDNFTKKFDLLFTEPSYCKDKSINNVVRAQMQATMPEKLKNLKDTCYRVGVITIK